MITEDDKERIAANMQSMTAGTVNGIKAVPSIIMRAGLYDEEALTYSELYPMFDDLIGKTLEPDWIIRHEGGIYRVNQKTVASKNYIPGSQGTESIYKKITFDPETGYEDWQQPTGAHDAYSFGDRVMHNGKIWESIFDGSNVWEPGAQGTEALWKDVTDEVSSDDQGGVEK